MSVGGEVKEASSREMGCRERWRTQAHVRNTFKYLDHSFCFCVSLCLQLL